MENQWRVTYNDLNLMMGAIHKKCNYLIKDKPSY